METAAAAARYRAASEGLAANLDALAMGKGDAANLLAEAALLVVELKSSSRATHLGVDVWRQQVREPHGCRI